MYNYVYKHVDVSGRTYKKLLIVGSLRYNFVLVPLGCCEKTTIDWVAKKEQKFFFSLLWRLRSPRSRGQQIQCLVRTERMKRALWSLFCKSINPIHEDCAYIWMGGHKHSIYSKFAYHLNYTIQWFLVNWQSCTTILTI